MRILKYPINIRRTTYWRIAMPLTAKILALKLQEGVPTLWAEVPDSDEIPHLPSGDPITAPNLQTRTIVRYGTGEYMPDNPGHYIDTLVLDDDTLVLHFYEADQ